MGVASYEGQEATVFLFCFVLPCDNASARLASYPGHVGGGKSGLVSTVCACAND